MTEYRDKIQVFGNSKTAKSAQKNEKSKYFAILFK